MREGPATVIRREDYAAPAYWIRSVELSFDLDPAKTIVASRLSIERNAAAAAGQPLVLHGEGLNLLRVQANGDSVSFRQEAATLVIDSPPADAQLRARDPQHHRAGQEQRTQRPVHQRRRPVHAVRGRGLPPHHLLPGPARRDGGVQRHAARRQGEVPGAAEQRQPRRIRRSGQRPPLREMARPAPQAELSVRAGRRRPGGARAEDPQPHRARSPAAGVRQARRPRQDRTRDELADRRAGLGRGALRPEPGPGALHDRRGRGLQLRRDGEQGPEPVQHQVRAGQRRHRHRRRLLRRRERGRPRVLPQLDRQPRHLPRLVPAVAEGGPDGLPRPGIQHGHGRQRVGARRQAHRGRARSCAPCSSPRTPARWRTRCGPRSTAR